MHRVCGSAANGKWATRVIPANSHKALDVIEPHYAMLICIIEIGTRKLHLLLPVIALLMFLFFDSQISKLLSDRVGECIR